MEDESLELDEFCCVDCGRHMVRLVHPPGADRHRCGACILLPGWFCDDGLKALLDPGGMVSVRKN